METSTSTNSIVLPPLKLKRQLSSASSSPYKRRKVDLVSSSSTTSPVAVRPNMTASSSITLDMLRPHFEEPLAKVAATFGICVTLLKKICRRHGIARWPHRQITGLRKSIASMEHAIGYFDGDRRESYAHQLLKQKNKLTALLDDPTTNNPLLASEEEENASRQPKGPSVHDSVTRASSPTGPLLTESPNRPAMPGSSSSFEVESSYQQFYPLSTRHQSLPEDYPTTNYYMHGRIPTTSYSSSPAIYLPPLRRESRLVLPPISSLVMNNNNFNTPTW